MTAIRVEWAMYPEQREQVEPHLTRALHYAPSVIETLGIMYDGDETNLASTSMLPEYRTGQVRVGSGWFAETQDERAIAILHEVLHGHVEALAVVFSDLLKAAVPEDDAPLRKWAENQWRRAEEGMITELSNRIHERDNLIP